MIIKKRELYYKRQPTCYPKYYSELYGNCMFGVVFDFILLLWFEEENNTSLNI